jgi:hypothetical protein
MAAKKNHTAPNPETAPAPEKKASVGRNLTGFAGQTMVALLGTTAVAPFRGLEIALAMTGQTIQLIGITIETAGLGVSWVGCQVGRPGDAIGQAARLGNERVRAWRTRTQPQELGDYVPITCATRRTTDDQVAALKAKAKGFAKGFGQAFTNATEAPALEAPAAEAHAQTPAEA